MDTRKICKSTQSPGRPSSPKNAVYKEHDYNWMITKSESCKFQDKMLYTLLWFFMLCLHYIHLFLSKINTKVERHSFIFFFLLLFYVPNAKMIEVISSSSENCLLLLII